MDALLLSSEFDIERSIVFLCGPYYNAEDNSDRRKILQKFFYDEFKGSFLPLVIDDFVTEENIKDPTINVQLLEEIFAAISCKTYIFLDTMSAATELGLFANNSLTNKVQVFLPQPSDIINKSNVGYFVKNIVLKHNIDRVDCLLYRPKIIRKPVATDFVVEHYGFIKDSVPQHISEKILSDMKMVKKSIKIVVEDKVGIPNDSDSIFFQFDQQRNIAFVSINLMLLFNLVSGVIYFYHNEELIKKLISNFEINEVENITNKIIGVFRSFLKIHTLKNINDTTAVEVKTILNYDFNIIIKHIMKFVLIYHNNSRFHGYNLVKNLQKIYTEISLKKSPIEMFALSTEEIQIIDIIKLSKQVFFTEIEIVKNRKKRKLVTYSELSPLNKERSLHERLVSVLNENYNSNENSYAYKKANQ